MTAPPNYAATQKPRMVRCPSCNRLLGFTHAPADHQDCPVSHELKCGRCNSFVSVPMNLAKPATLV